MISVSKSLKRVIRRSIGEAAAWLYEEPHGGFAYHEINAHYRQLMRLTGVSLRESYTWGALHASFLAAQLGFRSVSLLEFGVAGGRGLLALDQLAPHIERVFGITVQVHGFDTGVGLPAPSDYRDLPNLWAKGDFPMDHERLRRKLSRAQLVLGNISETVPRFLERADAPVGFIAIDLDLHSSTVDALKLFDGSASLLLPRVHCYFDDIQGFTFSEFNGERLAIDEFNTAHPRRKISPIHGLRHFVPREVASAQWVELFYLAHIFDHPRYVERDGLLKRNRLDI